METSTPQAKPQTEPDIKPKQRRWVKRLYWGVLALIGLLILCLIALRLFITTAAGGNFIAEQINKRSFGPIESLQISGLSGDPLDTLFVESIKLKDKEGLWLEAQNIELSWKPFAYFKGHIWVQKFAVENTQILRRPNLNSSNSEGDIPKVTIESFNIKTIDLNAELAGQFVSLETQGQFIAQPSGAVNVKLKAERLDREGDSLALDFSRTDVGVMSGVFDLEGQDKGPIAELLKAPIGSVVKGHGTLKGTPENGEGALSVYFGGAEAVAMQTLWTPEALKGNAVINLEDWPAFEAVKQRLGPTLDSELNIDRRTAPHLFSADINVPGLSVRMNGVLPKDEYRPHSAVIDAKVNKLSAFYPLPEGYAAGSAEANGTLNLRAPYKFNGKLTVNALSTPYGKAQSITGPLNAEQNTQDSYSFKTDLNIRNLHTDTRLPVKLAPKTSLSISGQYNSETTRLTLANLSLSSGANTVQGKGSLTTDGQALNLTGQGVFDIISNDALASDTLTSDTLTSGALKAEFALRKTPKSLLAISTNGAFRPSAELTPPLDDLIGEQLVFNIKMNPVTGGVQLSEASLMAGKAKAAMTGTIGQTLNISGEALLSGPLEYKGVSLGREGQENEARFTVTGPIDNPALRLDAETDRLSFQNYAAQNIRLRTEISDILKAPKGPVQIDAETPQGAFMASAQFASTTDSYIAEDINITLGRQTVNGALKRAKTGLISGQLNLRLPEQDGQYARAALTLSDASGEQGLGFTIDAKEIALGEFRFDNLQAEAQGTLAGLNGTIETQGQRGDDLISRQFKFEAPFSLDRKNGSVYSASISPEAFYGDIKITSRGPILSTYEAGRFDIKAPLSLSDGDIDISYLREAADEEFSLVAKNLPITLLALPGNLADTRGRASAEIELSSNAQAGIQGGGVMNLTDWRGFDVDKGDGLTSAIRFAIENQEADFTLEASAPNGFNANGDLRLPLIIQSELLQTRLDMERPLTGNFTASGAAAAIFGLVTPSQAELDGSLSAKIIVSGTAQTPRVEGQASGRDIRFEAPELGTRIREGRFTANFTNDNLSVQDVFVRDSEDGTLSGAGEFKLGELGRPLGKLDIAAENFRGLDRRDVEAKVSGALEFLSEAKSAKLSGDITINRAEVKQFVSGNMSVIEIDVEEINRPDQDDVVVARKPATPIDLDINIDAPRRIYIRSRGLDVEMGIKATIKGTLVDPLFTGEATVIRGGYKIAGKTLDFEDGTITFDGDLADARVDFTAVTETQNLDASVTIGGTVSKPEIELSSTPERPQDEILSALLFGRSATELSTIEAAQLAGALAQFSGAGGGFDLLGGLRSAFGIAQLSVSFSPDGSAQLVGGRYLAKDVYLQVFSGAGPDQTGAIIDWEIRKNISLSSRIRADNEQALSLKWERDF